MANIKLTDIDFTNESIRVMGKGNKGRRVRIGKTTQKALLTYIMKREDKFDCLWVTEERRPMSIDGVKIAVRRLIKQAEIKSTKRGAHILRHTMAVSYLRNGGDVFTLKELLGHATLDMTRRYSRSLAFDDAAKAHKKASPVDNLKF